MSKNKGPIGAWLENVHIAHDLHLENLTAVENHIYQQYSPQPTALKLLESWNVPQRNLQFTGRKEMLREIDQRLNQPHSITAACVGLGGVGKTHLVLEYVHRNLNTYCGGIAWFSCRDKNSLIKEFIGLGIQLGVIQSEFRDQNNQQQSDDDSVKVLKTWLEDKRRSGWLLIFDDVEKWDDVCHLFPNKGGKIIVTSRYKIWDNAIVVDAFQRFESVEYFQKVCPNRGNDEEWNELASILGDLPLALYQSSAYLKENETVSLANYFQKYLIRKKSFLNSEKIDNDNKIPVYLTWDITMEKITEKSQLAVKLLRVLAFLDPNNIPHNIFEHFVEIFNPNGDKSQDIEEMIGILHRYSFLTYNSKDKSSTMHSLLQEVLRLKVVEEADVDLLIKTMVLFRLRLKRNRPSLINQKEMYQLVPHCESLLKFSKYFLSDIPGNDKRLKRFLHLFYMLWFLFGEICYYSKAFEKALVVTNEHLRSIKTRRNFDYKITLNSSCYETEVLSILGKIHFSVTGNVAILENLADVFLYDNKMNEMSSAHILMSILSEYSNKNDESKRRQLLDKVFRIYNKTTLRCNTILLIFHYWFAHQDKGNIVRKFEKFLDDSPVGTSPLEECVLYRTIGYTLEHLEKPVGGKNNKLIPFPTIYSLNLNDTIRNLEKKCLEMTSEDILLKIPFMCNLAECYYELEDNKKVDFFLNQSENAIKMASKKSEQLFEALKALADAYFHTEQIIKAKAVYVECLQVALSVYDPRHFNVFKTRLVVYMMTYIIDGDENSWKEIKKLFNNPSTSDREFMKIITDIFLQFSFKAFECGRKSMAVQVLNDLLILNVLFYSFYYTIVEINRETLRTILTNGGECEKYISKLKGKLSDSGSYYMLLIISETWVMFLLLCSLYNCLPAIQCATHGENHFEVTCSWPDNVKMMIIDDSFDFIGSFLRIIQLIPLNEFDLCHLLERKGKILRALGQYESAYGAFKQQSHILTQWGSFNKRLRICPDYYLGVTYADLGLHVEAEQKLLSALKRSADYYGPHHKVVATICYYMGTVYMKWDRWDQAKEYFSTCLKIETQLYKDDDVGLVAKMRIRALNLFVNEYDIHADYGIKKKEAMKMLLMGHCKPLFLKKFHENFFLSELVTVVTEHALMCYIIKNYDEATLEVNNAGKILQLFYNINNLEVAKSLIALADISTYLENYTSSKVYLQKALSIYSNVHGHNHKDTIETYFKMGSVFTRLNDFSEAYNSFVKGLSSEEDKTTLCWSLLRLGHLFWQVDKKSHIPLKALLNKNPISELWQLLDSRQKFNDLNCCDKELVPFWITLQHIVEKHKKAFSPLNRELVLSELEMCKKSNSPFNSPQISYFLFLIANSYQEHIRNAQKSKKKHLQSYLFIFINYTVQQILMNFLFSYMY